MTDGKSAAAHLPVLLPLWPGSGALSAWMAGYLAGMKRDMKSNPQFANYSERVAYRSGWLRAMAGETVCTICGLHGHVAASCKQGRGD